MRNWQEQGLGHMIPLKTAAIEDALVETGNPVGGKGSVVGLGRTSGKGVP